MTAIGEDVSYDYLVGVSGLAFRMQVSKGVFCPSSPHPNCGYPCLERSRRALPWQVQPFEVNPDDTRNEETIRKAVAESIDRGVPVEYGGEEEGVVIGYQNSGQEWICLHPWNRKREGGTTPYVEKALPWGIGIFQDRKDTIPSMRELAIEALQQAVDMAKTADADNYYVGFKAWQEYVDQLRGLEQVDDDTRGGWMVGNSWIYECLASFRGVAARYLRAVSGEFNPNVSAHLLRAADLYGQMSNEVLRDGVKGALDIAPLPWSMGEQQVWPTEMRQEQIQRLEAALALERQALGEIEDALSAIEVRRSI